MLPAGRTPSGHVAFAPVHLAPLDCRWLLHVLPKGLTRIRHYGYLGSAARKTRLTIRAMLGELGEPAPKLPELEPITWQCCGSLLTFLREIKPVYLMRGPPRRPQSA